MKEYYDLLNRLYPTWNSGNYPDMSRTFECKDIDIIPKVHNAGEIITHDGYPCQVMHNGVLIHEGCYHMDWMTNIIKKMKGHHEPQEEKIFYEVLKYVKDGGVMIECGSFWAYYSLWFHKEIKNANNIMIEPHPDKFEMGKHNFNLNNFNGNFLQMKLGEEYIENSDYEEGNIHYTVPQITIDWLIENEKLEYVDMVHGDMQNEVMLLNGCKNSLKEQKINFIILGTHSNNCQSIDLLEKFNYHILTSVEISESYFDDGLILACSDKIFTEVNKDNFIVSKYEKSSDNGN
jgi:FkbM family methyltransferase